ncbi:MULTISPECIES: response regulator [Cellulophaga]|uniref:Response regulator receiver n=2 Tax=Cellulophaga TaxID=104264 RepID=F0REW3_CELLC|nr:MULTISPECIES: response regulator [Cellulophaga]ADY28918.1 response regulator receiver [Cellulophaga lytica DSM 7489]AIM59964.1 transcriptional regulator [Cellulophaga lytica]APU09837.1 transcriptional regulator [Cellulophaga lytica]EWH13294.1 response regulator receiver [Cellulophaga geojensis KL-A]MDO6854445.1 response regulator [Cellulophaga lytica]
MNKIFSACIIDDDPIFVYGTKRIMKEVGFSEEIEVFENGLDAIEELTQKSIVEKKLPRLIFLDLNMPIMNGWEFLDDFVKIPEAIRKDVVIYIVSSSIDPRDIERVKTYDIVTDYILKPVTPKDLKNMLDDLSA